MEKRARLKRSAAGLLVMLLLGCHGTTMVTAPGQPDYSFSGQVDMGALYPGSHAEAAQSFTFYSRKVLATTSDIASASTVSLMQNAGDGTAQTVATAVTNGKGQFNLGFAGFTPNASLSYVLEAVKGLYGNAINKDAVRIRTLMVWNPAPGSGGGWMTLTNTLPNTGIVLGIGSTAASAMYGLNPSGISVLGLMGSVTYQATQSTPLPPTTDTFAPPSAWPTGVVDFHNVCDLVSRSILGDSDPITAVQYGNGVYFVKTAKDPFIDSLSTAYAGFGAPLKVTGQRFDLDSLSSDTVYFGGATGSAVVVGTNPLNNGNVLYVNVPEGAPSGMVQVRNSYGVSNGLQFTVIPRSPGQFLSN